MSVGYELPNFYGLEVDGGPHRGVVLRGVDYGTVEITAELFTESHQGGAYRTGLVFRAHPKDPADGDNLEARQENYYAFVVEPAAGVWRWLHNDSAGFRELASGPLPAGTPDLELLIDIGFLVENLEPDTSVRIFVDRITASP